jgi:hypothetical protein
MKPLACSTLERPVAVPGGVSGARVRCPTPNPSIERTRSGRQLRHFILGLTPPACARRWGQTLGVAS